MKRGCRLLAGLHRGAQAYCNGRGGNWARLAPLGDEKRALRDAREAACAAIIGDAVSWQLHSATGRAILRASLQESAGVVREHALLVGVAWIRSSEVTRPAASGGDDAAGEMQADGRTQTMGEAGGRRARGVVVQQVQAGSRPKKFVGYKHAIQHPSLSVAKRAVKALRTLNVGRRSLLAAVCLWPTNNFW